MGGVNGLKKPVVVHQGIYFSVLDAVNLTGAKQYVDHQRPSELIHDAYAVKTTFKNR